MTKSNLWWKCLWKALASNGRPAIGTMVGIIVIHFLFAENANWDDALFGVKIAAAVWGCIILAISSISYKYMAKHASFLIR